MKVTPQQLERLASLRGNRDFETFLEVLADYERSLTERALKGTDEVVIFRAQGGVEALRELVAAYREAPKALEKLK